MNITFYVRFFGCAFNLQPQSTAAFGFVLVCASTDVDTENFGLHS